MAFKHFGLQEGYYENYTSLILLLSSLRQLLRSSSLWFIPMLNKPCLAAPAQTCMKCKMRKTQTQTCRNGCGGPVLFYLTLYILCKADCPQCLVKGKEGRREVKDASSAVTPSLSLSTGVPLSPSVPDVFHHSYTNTTPFSWWIYDTRHTHMLAQTRFDLINHTKSNKPLSVPFLPRCQPTGNECGLWHTHPT